MKRLLLFILISIAIQPFLSKDASAAKDKEDTEPILIATYEEDITGDGLKEKIELKGMLFSQDSNYYREIWIDITNEYSNRWKITYEGGYEPALQFLDLNQDGINDILFQSLTGGSGGTYNNHLHTVESQKAKEIALPKQHHVKAKFKKEFKIEIMISPNSKPIILDVKDRTDDHIPLGIYDKQGKLLRDAPVIIKPISFKPLLISKSKGYGLMSYQQISGAYNADPLGAIETLWYYEKDNWVILKTEWVALN